VLAEPHHVWHATKMSKRVQEGRISPGHTKTWGSTSQGDVMSNELKEKMRIGRCDWSFPEATSLSAIEANKNLKRIERKNTKITG